MRSIANSWFLSAWEKNPEIFEGFRREVAAHVEKRQASGGKFNDFVAHMSELARIANGVALEVGIADGTISPDDVIADLLRMGAVKPQELVDADFDKLKLAFNELKTLAGNLEGDDKVKAHEKRYLILEKLRKSPTIDITKVPGMNEYEQELKGAEFDPTLKQTIQTYKTFAGNLKEGFQKVKAAERDKQKARDESGAFALLKEYLTNVEGHANKFNDVTDAIAKLKQLEHANFLHVLLKEFEYTGEVIGTSDPVEVTKMENNFGKIEQSGNSIADNLQRIDNVLKLLVTRVHPELIQQTAGYQGLDKLLQATQSSLLSTALSFDGSRTLRQALEPLSWLVPQFEKLDKSWKDATPTSVEPILEVLEDGKKLIEDTKTISTDGKATIPKYQTCVDYLPKVDSDNADTVQQDIDKLAKYIHKLSAFDYIDKLKNLTEYKTIVSDMNKSTDKQKTAPEVVKKLIGLSNFDEMVQLFAKYDEDMTALDDFVKKYNAEVLKIVTTGYQNIKNYLTNLKKWLERADCLPDGEKLAEGIRLVQSIRSLKGTTKVEDTEKFVNSIGQTKTELAQLQKAVKDVKPADEELTKIKLLANSNQVSTEFGKAVNGLLEMKNLLDNESKLAALKNDASLVKSEADKFRSQLSTEDYQEIAKLGALGTEVDALLAKLKAFKSDVENLAPTKISDNFQAFQAAAAVPSLVVSPKLKQAVEKLEALILAPPPPTSAPTNLPAPANLQPMIKSLETLESMNLDFASYQFTAASGPLTSLETFFQDFTNSMQISAVGPGGQAPPAGVGTANGRGGLLGGEGTTAASNALMYSLIGGVCSLFLVVGGIIVVFCCLKRKKDRELAKELEEEKERANQALAELNIEKDKADKATAEVKQKEVELAKEHENVEHEKQKAEHEKQLKEEAQANEKKANEALKAALAKAEASVKELKALPAVYLIRPPKVSSDNTVDQTQEIVHEENVIFSLVKLFIIDITKNLISIKKPMLTKEYFDDLQRQFAWADTVDRTSFEFKTEWRHGGIPCRMETAVKLKGFGDDYFIHANVLPFAKNLWVLSQAPLTGGKSEGMMKKNTCEKHWAMIEQKNVVVVMQLCNFVEREQDDKKPGGFVEKDKCAKYYSEKVGETVTFGRYKVTTETDFRLDANVADDVSSYSGFRIRFKNTETANERTVDIIRYLGWPDHGVPEKPEVGYQIVKLLDTYEKEGNALVHCSAGIGRTGTVAAIKLGIELGEKGIMKALFSLITDLRGVRVQSVQDISQTTYVILSVTKYFMAEHNLQFLNEYSQLRFLIADYNNDNAHASKDPKQYIQEMIAYADDEQKKVDPDGLVKRKKAEAEEKDRKRAKKNGEEEKESKNTPGTKKSTGSTNTTGSNNATGAKKTAGAKNKKKPKQKKEQTIEEQ